MPRTQMITKTNAPTQCGIEFPYHTVCSDFMADFYYSFDRAQAHQLRTPHRACDHYFCLHLHPSCPFPFFFQFLPVVPESKTGPDCVSGILHAHSRDKRYVFFFFFFLSHMSFFKEKGRKSKDRRERKNEDAPFLFF